MAQAPSPAPATPVMPHEIPPPHFPTVFADGVMSIANSPTIVKFFFYRFEPAFSGDGRSLAQAFAQVIMPMDAFAQAFVFFESAVSTFVKQGLITQERIDQLRTFFPQQQPNVPQ
jgi:hypothetical protein